MKLFKMVKFSVFLFAAIALAALAGAAVPGGRLYRSPWFAALLVLLAANLVICRLMRFPWRIKKPKKPLTEEFVAGQAVTARRMFGNGLDAALEMVRARLRRAGFVMRFEKASGGAAGEVHIWAQKGPARLWGDWLAHAGIVVVLAGVALRMIFGFQEMLWIPAGEERAMKNRPAWKICCESFQSRLYPLTQTPMEFRSSIIIAEDGKEDVPAVIAVNKPFSHGGVRFYQSEYGVRDDKFSLVRIGLRRTGSADKANRSLSEITSLAGSLRKDDVLFTDVGQQQRVSGVPVRLLAFINDFYVPDPANKDAMVSLGPAVHLELSSGGGKHPAHWLLLSGPDEFMKNLPSALMSAFELPAGSGMSARFLEFEAAYAVGVLAVYDPGAVFAWAGGWFLIVGLALYFYAPKRKLWVILRARSPSAVPRRQPSGAEFPSETEAIFAGSKPFSDARHRAEFESISEGF